MVQGTICYYHHFTLEESKASGYAANKWKTWVLIQNSLALEPELSATKLYHLSRQLTLIVWSFGVLG